MDGRGTEGARNDDGTPRRNKVHLKRGVAVGCGGCVEAWRWEGGKEAEETGVGRRARDGEGEGEGGKKLAREPNEFG